MGTVNKTPTIPSTMLTSLARQRDERERFVYSHASKLKDAPLTGLPKMLLEQFRELAQRIEAQMRNEQEEQRFRSFVERYIIEVASKFNDPLKDGFNAICDGKAIY